MLNSVNKFNTFLPSNNENPRLTVLSNFKEISRIMTNSFLKQKELEAKYRNQTIPIEEHRNKEEEDACTGKMTVLMKKMLTTKNFVAPIKRGYKSSSSVEFVRTINYQSPLSKDMTYGSIDINNTYDD